MKDMRAPRDIANDDLALRQLGRELSSIVCSDDESEDSNAKTIFLESAVAELLDIANGLSSTAAQRTAACNPLCAVLEAYHASKNLKFQASIWQNNVWSQAFSFFLERSDVVKPRSMRQLLLVLSAILQEDVPFDRKTSVRQNVLERLLTVIVGHTSRTQLKPALQTVEILLQKDIFTIKELLAAYRPFQSQASRQEDNPSIDELFRDLLLRLFNSIPGNDAAHAAGRLVSKLVKFSLQQKQDVETLHAEGRLPPWVDPLCESLNANPEELQSYQNHVLPGLFSLDLKDYLKFLLDLGLESYIGATQETSSSLERRHQSSLSESVKVLLLFASLQVGKELGLVVDVDSQCCKIVQIRGKEIEIPDAFISRLLGDLSQTIRLSALSLLVSSAFITRTFTIGTLRALQQALPNIIADTDANARSGVLGLAQRLFDRLRAATSATSRDLKKLLSNSLAVDKDSIPDVKTKSALLQAHVDFLKSFIHLRVSDLRPTSSYQRHFVSLKCILIALKSGVDASIAEGLLSKQARGQTSWPFSISIVDDHLLRNLYDLLLNPFDDVRALAGVIVKLHLSSATQSDREPTGPNQERSQLKLSGIPEQMLAQAQDLMLRTGRADHADGVARLYELLCVAQSSNQDGGSGFHADTSRKVLSIVEQLVNQLESTLSIAEADMSLAVSRNPMHGIFASLTYIVDQPGFYSSIAAVQSPGLSNPGWVQLHSRIIECVRRMWACVQDVLCNDAPEGHIPSELEGVQIFSTKDVLSYSWRALKDASLLLRSIVTNVTLDGTSGSAILTFVQIRSLGQLCFTQLTELRHRGAFSTVAQTFAAFCARCLKEKDPQVTGLPEEWFTETMQAIQQKSTVLTRRSGGIPALMVGILTATPDGPLFERAMAELHAAASDEGTFANIEESNLPQVHALNCLKDIFTNTKLGQASEPYVGKALVMAGSKFESPIWAVRNCGLMLFRALMDRLLGNDDQGESLDSTKYSKLSYEKFPGLLDILLKSLRPKSKVLVGNTDTRNLASKVLRTEAVFPALQILQRAPPPNSHIEEVRSLISGLIRSPNWHIRDIAARTLARTYDPSQLQQTYESLSLETYSSQNELHGRLLTLRYALVMSKQYINTQAHTLYNPLLNQRSHLYLANPCPVTKSGYLDVLLLVAKIDWNRNGYKATDTNDHQKQNPVLPGLEDLIQRVVWEMVTPEATSQRDNNLSSLLRQSMVNFCMTVNVVCDAPVRPLFEEILEALSAGDEPETTVFLLETIASIIDSDASIPHGKLVEILLGINIFALSTNAQVTAALLSTSNQLLWRLTDSGHITDSIMTPLLNIVNNSKTQRDSTASVLESSLPILGIFSDLRLRTHQSLQQQDLNWVFADDFIELARRISCSLQDTRSFSERNAAVHSLDGLHSIWSQSGLVQARIGLTFATYDALNDDDDEIREVASGVATRILNASSTNTRARAQVPLIASGRLAQYMARHYSKSPDLFEGALCRLTGADTPLAAIPSRSFTEKFAHVRAVDPALFVKEKQNLFVDDAREALVWSRVLAAADAKSVPAVLAERLTTWMMDGLAVLTQTAKQEYDGPLGWTSKPDVFVLGLRVIHAADVLLQWREKTAKVPRKGSEIKSALTEFKAVAESSAVHEAWLHAVGNVLEKAALRKMESVKVAIRSIVGIY